MPLERILTTKVGNGARRHFISTIFLVDENSPALNL
jgi:hypothetical protein